MKRSLLCSVICIFCTVLYAQPNYVAGTSKLDGLSSSEPKGSNLIIEQRFNEKVGYLTLKANKTSPDGWMKFANGTTGWHPQWCFSTESTVEYGVIAKAEYFTGDGEFIKLDLIKDCYYTITIAQNSTNSSNNFSVFKTLTKPAVIESVTTSAPCARVETKVTATLSTEKSSDESIILAYSNGENFSYTIMKVEGTSCTAKIPASVNVPDSEIKYVVYSTLDSGLKVSDSDFDLLCLSQKYGSYSIATPIPEPTVKDVVIKAHHSSVNEMDFTDFASLYVSDYTDLTSSSYTGSYYYLWQVSLDGGTSWVDYSDGYKNNTNNIRPIKAGMYRCIVYRTEKSSGKFVSAKSNVIEVHKISGATRTISSNLPIIIVRTDEKDFPSTPSGQWGFLSSNEDLARGKEKRSVDVKIIWDETSTDDTSLTYTEKDITNKSRLYYDRKARMNYRGQTSMLNSRKNYAFTVGDDSCTINGTWIKDKKKMFHLNKTKDKDFILYASEADDTKMRNNLTLNLYEDMTGMWTSHGRYVRLFVNGEDKGIYIFMEKNKEEASRVKVSEDGFIFKLDKTDIVDRHSRTDGARSCFATDKSGWKDIETYGLKVDHQFEIVYPEWDEADFTADEWENKIVFLRNKLNEFESALLNSDYEKARKCVDYQSFADNFIINEFTKNVDAYRISQYYTYETANGKLKATPLWDTELGFNIDGWGSSEKGAKSTSGYLYDNDAVHSDLFTIPFWWNGRSRHTEVSGGGLVGDKCFKAAVRNRWNKHIGAGGALTEENINKHLDSYVAALKSHRPSVITNWVSSRREKMTELFADFPILISDASINDLKDVSASANVSFKVNVTTSGNVNYKWSFLAKDSYIWKSLSSTGDSHNINSVGKGDVGLYRCIITSNECDCVSDTVVGELTLGTVRVDVEVCDEGGSVSGSGDYQKNSNVEIKATAAKGYVFDGWDDDNMSNPRQLQNIREDVSYCAYFTVITSETMSTSEVVSWSPIVKERVLYISGEVNGDTIVSDLTGRIISKGKTTVPLPVGVYIVYANGQYKKIVIK